MDQKHTGKILFIDMDGVITDFETRLYELGPHIKDLPLEDNVRGNAVDKLCQEQFPFIFLDLEPIEGAIEAVNFLKQYYTIYFLSTPMWDVPESYTDKRKWIGRYFPDMKKRLILTHNKGLCKGDYLVDDRIKHGVEEFEGEHIHFGKDAFVEGWSRVISYLKIKDDLK